MTNEIKIYSNAFTAEELHELMSQEVQNSDVTYEIKQNPNNTLDLDPTTLVALATISSTLLTTLVTQLFGLWQKHLENKAKKQENQLKLDTATVRIKLPNGMEVDVPYIIAQDLEKLQTFLKPYEGTVPKQIALIA